MCNALWVMGDRFKAQDSRLVKMEVNSYLLGKACPGIITKVKGGTKQKHKYILLYKNIDSSVSPPKGGSTRNDIFPGRGDRKLSFRQETDTEHIRNYVLGVRRSGEITTIKNEILNIYANVLNNLALNA